MSEPAFAPIGTIEDLAAKLGEHQDLRSNACVGERLAACVLSKSRDELTQIAIKTADDPDIGHEATVERLGIAADSLKMRHRLVKVAIARLDAVSDETKGGAHDQASSR